MGSIAEPLAGADLNAGLTPPADDPNPAGSAPAEGGEPSGEPAAKPEAEAGDQPEAGAEGGEQTKEDGRVIPQWMKALQANNPEAYKKAKADLFEMRDRRSVHPTIQAAREEHDLVESLGGTEGANALREDAGFFKEAASQFLKGDPNFVKDLWQEDKIAAALHVQPMLDAFKTNDLDGYRSTIAKVWQNDFQQVGFAPALQNLMAAIQGKDYANAESIAKSIQTWHDSILDVAKRAEDPRVKTLLAERARQHETREQSQHQEFLKTYRTDTVNAVYADGEKAFDSFFKGRKIDPDDRIDLIRETLAIANRAVMTDKDFITQRDKHLELGDSKAAQRLTKARYAREFTDAAKRVARRYGVMSGPVKPSQQPKPNGQQPPPKGPAGYVAINARPQPEDIDRSMGRTTNEDIIGKRATLKDGRKVTWAHLK